MFKYSALEVRYWLKATFKSLRMLFTGKLNKDDLAGPVGVAQVIDTTIEDTKQYGVFTVILNMVNIALLLSVITFSECSSIPKRAARQDSIFSENS